MKNTIYVHNFEPTPSGRSVFVDIVTVMKERFTVVVPNSLAMVDKTTTDEDGNETVTKVNRFATEQYFDISTRTANAGEPILDHETGEQRKDEQGNPLFTKNEQVLVLGLDPVPEQKFNKLLDLLN